MKSNFSLVGWVPLKPLLAVLVSFIFFSFFAWHTMYTRQMNNVDYFTVNDDDNRYFTEFRKVFPKNEFFTITFQEENLFTPKYLELIKDLSKKLEALPEVLEVSSLANVDYTEGDDDAFTVRRFLNKMPKDDAGFLKLKNEAVNEPLYVPNLVSSDGKATSIVVFVKENRIDDSYRRVLLEKVHELLKPYQAQGLKFYKAGWTITNYSLSQVLNDDIKVFLPLCYIFITATIYLIFRNVTLVALALVNLSVCLISIVGLFGLTGITLNNLTAIALPLGITLSLADTVHIFSHLDKQLLKKFANHRDALSSILKSVVKPCFFTSVTTAIGFGSLAISHLEAMQDFAVIACLAMVFEFFYSFFLLPALLALMNPEKTFSSFDSSESKGFNAFLSGLFSFIERRNYSVFFSCIAVGAVALWFLFKVPVETNIINYFRESSDLRQNLNFVEKHVGGVATFEVSLTSDKEDLFKEPALLQYIDNIKTYLKTIPGIDSVNTISDFFKEMNKSFHSESPEFYKVPESRDQVEQFLLLYDGKDLDNVINSSFDHARVSVRMSLHSTKQQKHVLSLVRQYAKDNPPPLGVQIRPTGFAVNYVNTAYEMVDSQISSFGTASLIICVLMSIVLRSFKLGILSLVPNIYPVLLTFGIMGIFGIPLDTGTVMIASVALGIACDDTVHFLFDYKENLQHGYSPRDSIKHVMLHKGRAIMSTSLILTLGFAVLIFGSFIPVIHFGILCTITMVVAISGDLLLLPATMLSMEKMKKSKE